MNAAVACRCASGSTPDAADAASGPAASATPASSWRWQLAQALLTGSASTAVILLELLPAPVPELRFRTGQRGSRRKPEVPRCAPQLPLAQQSTDSRAVAAVVTTVRRRGRDGADIAAARPLVLGKLTPACSGRGRRVRYESRCLCVPPPDTSAGQTKQPLTMLPLPSRQTNLTSNWV
jgi:hypothetical protein